MDSAGNSGSMQSSSTGGGGDEAEYDSYSHAFFHVGGGGGGNGGGGIQPPSSLQQQESLLFDSLSNFLTNDHNHSNNNPFSTPPPPPPSLLNLDILLQNTSSTIPSFNSSSPSLPMNITTEANIINNIQPNPNPKKRSRASRRAPTTVLTTDTSNFRAMVQEFTGIPAQPFTSSSSSSLLFPRSNRLDLFSNSSTTSRSCGGDSSFLLCPFAQKPIQVPPFPSSSSSSMFLNSNTSSASTANPNVSSSSTNSFQLGFPGKNNQSLLHMQNNNPTLIPYQSLHLQYNDAGANTSGGGGVGLPNLVTSDGLIRNVSSSWEDQDHLLRSFNGNYNRG